MLALLLCFSGQGGNKRSKQKAVQTSGRLTSRSSRRRYAPRLNSSVMSATYCGNFMKRKSDEGFLEARLYGLFASLILSVPTAFIIWMWANIELASFGGFIGSYYLVTSIAVFSVIALLFPRLFPSILGFIWHAMVKVARFWY